MAQWLGLRASTARGLDLIPCWGTKIPQAVRWGKKHFFEDQIWELSVALLGFESPLRLPEAGLGARGCSKGGRGHRGLAGL